MKWQHHPNLRKRPHAPARGRGRLQQQIRRLQGELRRAPEEQKAKLEAELEKLDASMPAPLASIYAVKDDPKQATPIHLLQRGDYQAKGARVGARPLGILAPEGAPELPVDTMRVAVDQEYHAWDAPIGDASEIALIPPVSGG